MVSVGDKTLPTNPTARDRRALQTTVAHKISARIVKTTTDGLRTIPPRRRGSIDVIEGICTPATTPSYQKSYPSVITPSSTLYSATMPPMSSCSSNTSTHHYTSNSTSTHNTATEMPNTTTTQLPLSRKRQRDDHLHRTTTNSSSSSSTPNNTSSSNVKRFRGKKQKTSAAAAAAAAASTSPVKRQTSDSDETDTIEKRNLHNDMERQRRIGLKNLFEELKFQIPSLKDKERAPKVNILREAANLCRKYNREEEERIHLKKVQTKLYSRVSVLRTSLAAQRSRNE